MPLYDFTCESGHTTELRAGYEIQSLPCPTCGLVALRESIYLDQCCITETGAKYSRRAEVPRDEKRLDKGFKLFQEATQEIDYVHKKNEESVGHTLPDPPLWKKAKRKARDIQLGKIAPIKGTA